MGRTVGPVLEHMACINCRCGSVGKHRKAVHGRLDVGVLAVNINHRPRLFHFLPTHVDQAQDILRRSWHVERQAHGDDQQQNDASNTSH